MTYSSAGNRKVPIKPNSAFRFVACPHPARNLLARRGLHTVGYHVVSNYREFNMDRMTVLLSAAFILAVSPGVHAETIFVAEVPSVQTWPNGAAILEFRHDNPGRAWVSATFCGKLIASDPENSDCRPYNEYNFRVRGLAYDSSSGAIRLGSHVCAWTEPGILRSVDRQTGQCTLSVNTVRHDDRRLMGVINIQLR
jgi:hypothetical protein